MGGMSRGNPGMEVHFEFAESKTYRKCILRRLTAVTHISQKSVPKSRFLTAWNCGMIAPGNHLNF